MSVAVQKLKNVFFLLLLLLISCSFLLILLLRFPKIYYIVYNIVYNQSRIIYVRVLDCRLPNGIMILIKVIVRAGLDCLSKPCDINYRHQCTFHITHFINLTIYLISNYKFLKKILQLSIFLNNFVSHNNENIRQTV